MNNIIPSKETLQWLNDTYEYIESSGEVINRITETVVSGTDIGVVLSHSVNYKQVRVLAHQWIWYLKTGKWSEITITHKDGNNKNNIFSNLEPITIQNSGRGRRKMSKPTSSKYKGVCFQPSNGRWMASIGYAKGCRKTIGRFDSEEEAAQAYNEAAIKYFGEFALLNIL